MRPRTSIIGMAAAACAFTLAIGGPAFAQPSGSDRLARGGAVMVLSSN